MTVKTLAEKIGLKPLLLPCGEREVNGVYCGDLLSWVMGRAECDNAWITIMSNVNVVAVASLLDVSCVILAEGVALDEDALKAANEKQINVLVSDKSTYETAVELGKVL
ncbi:MAG: hypothetical protein IJ370_03040 [Oscillospiraceae bacterium]|nr:hypothetical protein [Oscillospiraceae bacterium]